MRCGLLLSCHSEDNLTILLLWVRHSTWCPFQASLNANCSYQRRLNKGFQLWITDDFILPQSPYIKGYSCLGHKWEEKEGDTPCHINKSHSCALCAKRPANHTINIKLRCWEQKTWGQQQQQQNHNFIQNSYRSVFCFYCSFFLINTTAFVQILLLSCYQQCAMGFLTH